jgi:hypothetical protein
MKLFMLFIGVMLLVIGVKLIYDARIIVNKYFSVNDKNTATIFLKVIGTVCIIVGAILASRNIGLLAK